MERTTDFSSKEAVCMTAFCQGEAAAIEVVFRKYYPLLVNFARKMTGSLEEAEDIAGDTFVKLYKKRENFSTEQHIKSFLLLTTKNACINYLKSVKVGERYQKEVSYLASAQQGYDYHWMSAEIMRIIEAEIDSLPSRTKEIFRLAFFQKMTLTQIADHLGVHVNTIQTEKNRALNNLRTLLLKKDLLDVPVQVCLTMLVCFDLL